MPSAWVTAPEKRSTVMGPDTNETASTPPPPSLLLSYHPRRTSAPDPATDYKFEPPSGWNRSDLHVVNHECNHAVVANALNVEVYECRIDRPIHFARSGPDSGGVCVTEPLARRIAGSGCASIWFPRSRRAKLLIHDRDMTTTTPVISSGSRFTALKRRSMRPRIVAASASSKRC